MVETPPRRYPFIAEVGRHAPEHWPSLVRELEASYQAVQLAKADRALGVRLLWLRLERITWEETLETLRRQSLR